ncbi:hypothetical protein MIT9_P0826 [Methylomarinovum caldicuralii]|uniref:DUF4194 domain-containing protein n=1 Tax=Methylomarinovum caldicuralii TaxID=438856 RepID=A0AAU9CMV8_9GAMM|nr:DUF4194 domain-containing protein [Methylomarinovum caldicuralii]BCX81248.1 hypothetical protein MIT9_P0826 [Methylomarinovum caldicuralii]
MEDPLPQVLIPLLKGVVYAEADPPRWQKLLDLQARIREVTGLMGLELIIDEAEGHAFLRQREFVAEETPLPRLVPRRPLSFPVSLLLALLRRRLLEFDQSGADTRLVLHRDDIAEMVRVFLPESSNEAKLLDRLDRDLKRIEELGFLRRLKGQEHLFEVQRILKSFVDAQWLGEFNERLAAYRKHLEEED